MALILGNLPPRLRRLAEIRANQLRKIPYSSQISIVSLFSWGESPEGAEFWSNVYLGNFPPEDDIDLLLIKAMMDE